MDERNLPLPALAVSVDEFTHKRFGTGAAETCHFFTIFDQQHGREAAYLMAACQFHVFVFFRIELGE